MIKESLALSRVGCDALKVVRLSLRIVLGILVESNDDHTQSAPLMNAEPGGARAGDMKLTDGLGARLRFRTKYIFRSSYNNSEKVEDSNIVGSRRSCKRERADDDDDDDDDDGNQGSSNDFSSRFWVSTSIGMIRKHLTTSLLLVHDLLFAFWQIWFMYHYEVESSLAVSHSLITALPLKLHQWLPSVESKVRLTSQLSRSASEGMASHAYYIMPNWG